MFNIFPVDSEKIQHMNVRPILKSSGNDVIKGHDDSVKKVTQNPLFAIVKTLLAVN